MRKHLFRTSQPVGRVSITGKHYRMLIKSLCLLFGNTMRVPSATIEMGYLAVLQQQPSNLLARFGLANTLRMQGRLDAAVIEYEKLLNQDPRYKPGLNKLADTLLRLGRCQEAAALLQHAAINENPLTAIDRALLETRIEIESTCSAAR